MEMVVRMEGVVENVLNTLVKKGYYKTKSEALRAGILELGKEYALIGSENELAARKIGRMEAEAAAGRKKFTPLEEVLKEARKKSRKESAKPHL